MLDAPELLHQGSCLRAPQRTDAERGDDRTAVEVRRQNVAFVGEQGMGDAGRATAVLEFADFALVAAIERDLGAAVKAKAVSSGSVGIDVDAFEQGRRIGVA
ncbi:hypothetical protein D3C71_2017820 [compost metagenome]